MTHHMPFIFFSFFVFFYLIPLFQIVFFHAIIHQLTADPQRPRGFGDIPFGSPDCVDHQTTFLLFNGAQKSFFSIVREGRNRNRFFGNDFLFSGTSASSKTYTGKSAIVIIPSSAAKFIADSIHVFNWRILPGHENVIKISITQASTPRTRFWNRLLYCSIKY